MFEDFMALLKRASCIGLLYYRTQKNGYIAITIRDNKSMNDAQWTIWDDVEDWLEHNRIYPNEIPFYTPDTVAVIAGHPVEYLSVTDNGCPV